MPWTCSPPRPGNRQNVIGSDLVVTCSLECGACCVVLPGEPGGPAVPGGPAGMVVWIGDMERMYYSMILRSCSIRENTSQNTEKQQFRRFDNLRLSSSVNSSVSFPSHSGLYCNDAEMIKNVVNLLDIVC